MSRFPSNNGLPTDFEQWFRSWVGANNLAQWPGVKSDYLRVQRAARRVKKDFDIGMRSIDAQSLSFEIDLARHDDDNWFHVLWRLNGVPGRIIAVGASCDEEFMTFQLADELSEKITEHIALVSPRVAMHWPPCPRHPHALSLVFDDTAFWQCRDDADIRALVGALESLVTRSPNG